MFVKGAIDECDFTGKKYLAPVSGAWAIAQGATGRWCCVMEAGPEYLKKANIVPIEYDEAVAECTKRGGLIDF